MDAPSERLASLDALRMLAAIAVFTYHVSGEWNPRGSLVDGGYVGVSVFFVLSGFLLYRPFVAGPVKLRSFALRRVARIYPAYWFALVPMALLDWRGFSSAPLAFITLTQNYVPECPSASWCKPGRWALKWPFMPACPSWDGSWRDGLDLCRPLR